MKDLVASLSTEKDSQTPTCPACGSNEARKRGYRYNRSGKKQCYQCLSCGERFVHESLQNLKTEATVVMAALDLYFRGLSLRQTSEHLESVWKRKVSYGSILKWVQKFVQIADRGVAKHLPVTPERWNVDETVVRLNGRQMLWWSLLDPDSRFLIAAKITRRRTRREARAILKAGRKMAGAPREVVTDGLKSYPLAVKDVLGRGGKVIHISGPGLDNGQNNNRVERLHGSIKKRVTPIGAFRSRHGAETFARGYRIFHNYVKPHRTLGNRTPAEAVGLTEGKTGWSDLVAEGNRKVRRRRRAR